MYEGPISAPALTPFTTRATSIRYTSLGPVVLTADADPPPEGWAYDEYGVAYTNYAGTNYKFEGGKFYKYTAPAPVTGAVGAAAGPAQTDWDPWREVTGDEIPRDAGFGVFRKKVKVPGVPSQEWKPGNPGKNVTPQAYDPWWENRPAPMGGPRNADNFLGAEFLASPEGGALSAQQIATYGSTGDELDPGKANLPGLGKKDAYRGTYYQRMQIGMQVAQGFGRPQYTDASVSDVYNYDQATLVEFQMAARKLGLPGATMIVVGQVDPYTVQSYRAALTNANLAKMPLTPYLQQVLALQKAAEAGATGTTTGSAAKFDPVKTRTSVNLTSKARARAQLRTMMTNLLGRAPTNSEVEDYLGKLNAKEKADPSVTTYNYQRDGDVTTTTEETDVDAVQIAQNYAKKENPKEYQAMQRTNYYNAFLDLLGSA